MNTLKPAGIKLNGIDGVNPLGFLAAIGTVAILSQDDRDCIKLAWQHDTTWVPVLYGCPSKEQICSKLCENLQGRPVDQKVKQKFRDFYKQKKELEQRRKHIQARKLKKDGWEKVEEELKPLREQRDRLRKEWLAALASSVPSPELALGRSLDCTPEEFRERAKHILYDPNTQWSSRLSIDMLAAFGSDACCDEKKQVIETTPFCFIRGSGHQWFLETAQELMAKVSKARIEQTLFQTWTYRDSGLSMRWDPSENRQYALSDVDPSDQNTHTEWMANLLAYRGLSLFPGVPSRSGLRVVGWLDHNESESFFVWPIWEFPATIDVIRTCLVLASTLSFAERRARGIAAVYESQRVKVGEGSNFKINFSPARLRVV